MADHADHPSLPLPGPGSAPDRRSVLRAAGLLGALGAVGGTAMNGAPARAAGGVTSLDAEDFTLSADYTLHRDLVDALAEQAGRASTNDVMENASLSRHEAHAIDGQKHGFRWEPADEDDENSYPQGITTTRDAVGTAGNGRYDGRQLIAVSFYGKSPATSRLHLVDWDSNYPNTYERVLLVEPTGTPEEPSFKDVDIHVGGIVWYGDHLYVADTGNGMRIFDMRTFLRTEEGGDAEKIGRVGDEFHARGHAFALPQVGRITSEVAEGTKKLIWSTISLDRPKRSIVMTEYTCSSCDSAPNASPRAVRFPVAEGGDTFAEKTIASQALELPFYYLNGVASHNGRWWFANSHDKDLYYWGGSGQPTKHDGWVSWPESISYYEVEDGPDLLFTLQEGVGNRTVFAVAQADYTT